MNGNILPMELSDSTKKHINSFTADIIEKIRQARGVNEQIRSRWQASGYTLEQLQHAGVKPYLREMMIKYWEDLQEE